MFSPASLRSDSFLIVSTIARPASGARMRFRISTNPFQGSIGIHSGINALPGTGATIAPSERSEESPEGRGWGKGSGVLFCKSFAAPFAIPFGISFGISSVSSPPFFFRPLLPRAAIPPAAPASRRFSIRSEALSLSRSTFPWTHLPSWIVKYGCMTGRSFRHSTEDALTIGASTRSSSGAGPFIQESIISNRYAPCCSRVSLVVSCRYRPT